MAKSKIQIAIDKIKRDENFKIREGVGWVCYDRYLTPGLSSLNQEQLYSGLLFSLKRPEQIDNLSLRSYKLIFDFNSDIKCWGNDNQQVNLYRSLYDLSFRYRGCDNVVLEKCRIFILAYCKLYQLPFKPIHQTLFTSMTYAILIHDLGTFFNLPPNDSRIIQFKSDLERQFNQIKAEDFPTPEEYKILEEFAYFPPASNKIPHLMSAFYKEYTNKEQDENVYATAAWVIKTICDIHPFNDGNGRTSRMIAFNLLGDRYNLRFTPDEIKKFGEDPDYINATTRGINLDRLELWLSGVVSKKIHQFRTPIIRDNLAITLTSLIPSRHLFFTKTHRALSVDEASRIDEAFRDTLASVLFHPIA
jgi:fido (protein-threonine AMPylation protein)